MSKEISRRDFFKIGSRLIVGFLGALYLTGDTSNTISGKLLEAFSKLPDKKGFEVLPVKEGFSVILEEMVPPALPKWSTPEVADQLMDQVEKNLTFEPVMAPWRAIYDSTMGDYMGLMVVVPDVTLGHTTIFFTTKEEWKRVTIEGVYKKDWESLASSQVK